MVHIFTYWLGIANHLQLNFYCRCHCRSTCPCSPSCTVLSKLIHLTLVLPTGSRNNVFFKLFLTTDRPLLLRPNVRSHLFCYLLLFATVCIVCVDVLTAHPTLPNNCMEDWGRTTCLKCFLCYLSVELASLVVMGRARYILKTRGNVGPVLSSPTVMYWLC